MRIEDENRKSKGVIEDTLPKEKTANKIGKEFEDNKRAFLLY